MLFNSHKLIVNHFSNDLVENETIVLAIEFRASDLASHIFKLHDL